MWNGGSRLSSTRCVRDRSPIQTATVTEISRAGGFTTGEPWLRLHANHTTGINVADQRHDPGSLLSWYRSLIALRHARPSLAHGEQIITRADDVVQVFERTTPGERSVVAINMTDEVASIDVPGSVLLSTDAGPVGDLAPFEVRVIASVT